MQMNGIMGGIYTITEWIMRLAITNLLWLLFNTPVIFFGLNLLIVDTTGEIIFFSVILAILLPLSFFPATMAMFSLIRKWVMGEEDIRIVPSFWNYYKKNYVRSMLGGFIITIIWVILLVDYYYFVNFVNDLFKYFFYALSLFLIMFNIHFFSNNVHFHIKLSLSLKNSLLMTLKNPVISLFVVLINILIVVISFKIVPFLIPLFMGSLISIISFLAFYTISLRLPSS